MKKNIILISMALTSAFALTGCGAFSFLPGDEKDNSATEVAAESVTASVTEESSSVTTTQETTIRQNTETTPAEKHESELTLLAVGDNLIHDTVYEQFYKGDGIYDFHPLYENIKYIVEDYDIAVINQETIFVEDDDEISNYPAFGTPHEMGEALVDSGFDVILSSSNHTMDKGADNIEYMYDYWETRFPEVTVLGIHGNEEDSNNIDIVEKNGISLAMFNYTYGLNGYTLPEGREYLVDLLDDKEKFLSDIKTAEDKADMTVCFLHIGDEYVYEPTEFHKQYVDDVIDAGADLVICAHPHVVEPYGEITTANGNKGIVYYSCGNFVSAQGEIDRLLGGMASVTIKKTTQGDKSETVVSDYDFIPEVMHQSEWSAVAYALEDYTDTLASTHWITSYDSRFSVDYLWELWKYITE